MVKDLSYTKSICLIFALLLSFSVKAQNLDIQWLRNIHSNNSRGADEIMKGITNSSYAICGAVPVAELAYGYIAHDSTMRVAGWQSAAGLATTVVLSTGIKLAARRERPYTTYKDIIPYRYDLSYSMPSGHTSTAFSVATSLSLQFPKWYVIVPAMLWAGGVGYSRLYLGMHYPSDVFVAALLGAGSSYLSYKGQHWIQKHHKRRF